MGVSIWEGNKADRVASALEAIALNGAGGAIAAQNWKGAQNLIRARLGPKAYPVGAQFRVEKANSLTATMGAHEGITGVTVDEEKFLAAEGIVGTGLHEFVYDGGAWEHDGTPVSLAAYGLTVTGTPAKGDEVIVTEVFDEILFDVADHGYVDPETGAYIPASEVTDSTDRSQPAMALLMHYCIYNRLFDSAEALYYAEEELPAGTYHFALLAGYDTTHDGGKNVQFTLTQAVPKGGQIVMNWPYNQTWIGKNVTTYANGESTTVIETATMSEGTDGTDLGTADGTSANLNHTQRARYGSNNYAESAIRQWVNAEEAKEKWWKPTNKFDRPASYAANTPGYLHGMDSDFLSVVREVTIPCKTNNTFELENWEKNKAYTVKDRFFLASRDEIGYGIESGIESGIKEGGAWALYQGKGNEDKIKRDIAAKQTARNWWLRSPTPGNAYYARYVYTSGALNYNTAYHGYGAAPACIIY